MRTRMHARARAHARTHTCAHTQVARKVQLKLQAALYGTTPAEFFAKYDRDKGGTLDAAEFRKALRLGMKIPPVQVHAYLRTCLHTYCRAWPNLSSYPFSHRSRCPSPCLSS